MLAVLGILSLTILTLENESNQNGILGISPSLNAQNNRGNILFDDYFKESSYCFVINQNLITRKYFILNDQFPNHVNRHIDDITANNIYHIY